MKEIQKEQTGYILITQNGEIHARCVVNAAGVYADVFHNMVSENKIHITPRRGEYELLDRAAGVSLTRQSSSFRENTARACL